MADDCPSPRLLLLQFSSCGNKVLTPHFHQVLHHKASSDGWGSLSVLWCCGVVTESDNKERASLSLKQDVCNPTPTAKQCSLQCPMSNSGKKELPFNRKNSPAERSSGRGRGSQEGEENQDGTKDTPSEEVQRRRITND